MKDCITRVRRETEQVNTFDLLAKAHEKRSNAGSQVTSSSSWSRKHEHKNSPEKYYRRPHRERVNRLWRGQNRIKHCQTRNTVFSERWMSGAEHVIKYGFEDDGACRKVITWLSATMETPCVTQVTCLWLMKKCDKSKTSFTCSHCKLTRWNSFSTLEKTSNSSNCYAISIRFINKPLAKYDYNSKILDLLS